MPRTGENPVPIESIEASAYRVPTDATESYGTTAWNATTLVVVEAKAGGVTGLGYSYADASAAGLARGLLAEAIAGSDALSPQESAVNLARAVRNIGHDGVAATAISAVDVA